MAVITMSREELTSIVERNGAGDLLRRKIGLHLAPVFFSSKDAAIAEVKKGGGILFYSTIGNKWFVVKAKSDASRLEQITSFHRMMN